MIIKHKEKRIRARCQYIAKGERSNKYFLGLEKQRQAKKVIHEIRDKDNLLVTDENNILDVVRLFYKDLYTSEKPDGESIKIYLENTNVQNSLNETEKEICDGVLTKTECTNAIKGMKKNKSPGLDGLTVEFYEHFWNILGDAVLDALNEGYIEGEMSESQKIGLLSLIYKKRR